MSKNRLVVICAAALIVLMACSLSGGVSSPGPSQIPAKVLTSAAQTVVAAQTRGAPSAFPPEVMTAAAGTAIAAMTQAAPPATMTLTPTLTLTPTFTQTPTPSTPTVSVSVNTNCRTGPGDAYDRVGALLVGETAEVLARDPYGQFWYIPNPDQPGGYCWIWGHYATVTGETASLPVFTPPPTPTPSANYAIVGLTKKVCTATTRYFVKVSNTGGVTWRSFREVAKNLTTNASETISGNLFFGNPECFAVQGPYSDKLSPGEQAYLVPGTHGAPGQRVSVTVTLYTGGNQTGNSLTRTAEYTLP